MGTLNKVRIDKWLWSVRIFKTRNVSATACRAGKVKVGDKSVKPSYLLSVGETITLKKNGNKIIVKAVKLIERRVGASIAIECYEDHSPAEERIILAKGAFYSPAEQRDRGSGRPTKKERRVLETFKKKKED